MKKEFDFKANFMLNRSDWSLFQLAAKSEGYTNVSSWLRRILIERAKRIMRENKNVTE